MGIAGQVIFTGFQNTPFDYLATFDAFILASASEGLPRVVLEAMLLNIPVIGSKVTGTAELIDHEATGLLFLSDGNTKQLSQHLSALWQDTVLRQRLIAAAAARVRERYSIESYVNGVEAVLGAQ